MKSDNANRLSCGVINAGLSGLASLAIAPAAPASLFVPSCMVPISGVLLNSLRACAKSASSGAIEGCCEAVSVSTGRVASTELPACSVISAD